MRFQPVLPRLRPKQSRATQQLFVCNLMMDAIDMTGRVVDMLGWELGIAVAPARSIVSVEG